MPSVVNGMRDAPAFLPQQYAEAMIAQAGSSVTCQIRQLSI